MLRSILLMCVVVTSGCVAGRMQLDPQLEANAAPLAVNGMAWAQFRKPVTFGEYTGVVTTSGWKSSTKVQAGPYKRATSTQPYGFTMTGGTPASWTGDCTYGTSKQGALFPISDDAGLVCTLIPEGGQGWQLQLSSAGNVTSPNTLTGTLTDGATVYNVAMVHRLAGSAFASAEPVGYEVRDAGGLAIAAVQMFRPQQIWIDAKLAVEQQTALAVGAFALLVSAEATSDINEGGGGR